MSDDGILTPEDRLVHPDTAEGVTLYDTVNLIPFADVRERVFRQLERQHHDSRGPAKKVLAVNKLPIANVDHLWGLPFEIRSLLWEKSRDKHRSTTPPRGQK